MSDYSFDFNAVQQTIEELNTAGKRVNESLETFQADIERDISQWLGEPRNEYYNRKQEWQGAANTMNSFLGAATQALQHILIEIMQNEQRSTARYQR